MGLEVALIAGVALAAGGAAAASSMRSSPDAPDYASATREGVLADIETLPLRRMIDAAAKAGTKVTYTDPKTGETKTADFTGLGDIDVTRANLDFSLEAADTLAKAQLDLETKYGPEAIRLKLQELELADPEGFALRKRMGQDVLGDLEQGTKLNAETQAQVTEAERAGQALRGNILGQSAGAAEALGVGEAGLRLYQQRLANASAFLSGSTPQSQFTQISGAQQGAVAFNPVAPQQGAITNPQAGSAGAQYALGATGLNQQAAEYNQAPWQAFLGQLSGAGTGVAAGSAWGLINKPKTANG